MIIPTFYGGGGEQAYFDARNMIERISQCWAGRALTLEDKWALDEYMEKLKRRVSSSLEDRALETMIEEVHASGSL